MSRWEFMRQLEELLSDIAPAEREEALQYYNDYLNDAGRENEQDVIAALGTPEQVAQIVKDGLFDGGNSGEFTEQGFYRNEQKQNELVKRFDTKDTTGESGQNHFYKETWNAAEDGYADSTTVGADTDKKKSGPPTWAIVLIVITCILFSPVIIGVAMAILGVLFSVFCSVLGIVFGIGITTLVLFVVAVCLVIGGFGSLLVSPLAGIGLIGAGLICAAIGILFMLLLVLLVGKCIPGICQGIAYIFGKLFGKKGGAKE